MNKMNIALFQYAPVWESKTANTNQIISALENQDKKFDLLIFPEMTLTGFSMNSEIISENTRGATAAFFTELALEHNCAIIAGMSLFENKQKFNAAVYFNSEGTILGVYKKIHTFPLSDEGSFYSSGKEVVIINDLGIKIGLSVCYDLRFPELFRMYAKAGVELIVNIANWPASRADHWTTLLKARAIENQCFVAGVNRSGEDSSTSYQGESNIFGPTGANLVPEISKCPEIVTIDVSEVETVREKYPFLQNISLI